MSLLDKVAGQLGGALGGGPQSALLTGLTEMLGKGGWYRGSTTMISGESGSAKTTFAVHFANAACKRGERCIYLAFEE